MHGMIPAAMAPMIAANHDLLDDTAVMSLAAVTFAAMAFAMRDHRARAHLLGAGADDGTDDRDRRNCCGDEFHEFAPFMLDALASRAEQARGAYGSGIVTAWLRDVCATQEDGCAVTFAGAATLKRSRFPRSIHQAHRTRAGGRQ